MQFYSDPTREQNPHALPDAGTFYMLGPDETGENLEEGWYWQACFPGCLPDGDPIGPFDTEALAIADCRDGVA